MDDSKSINVANTDFTSILIYWQTGIKMEKPKMVA